MKSSLTLAHFLTHFHKFTRFTASTKCRWISSGLRDRTGRLNFSSRSLDEGKPLIFTSIRYAHRHCVYNIYICVDLVNFCLFVAHSFVSFSLFLRISFLNASMSLFDFAPIVRGNSILVISPSPPPADTIRPKLRTNVQAHSTLRAV